MQVGQAPSETSVVFNAAVQRVFFKLYPQKRSKIVQELEHVYIVYICSVVYTVYQFCFCTAKAIKGHTYLRSVHEFVLGVSNKIPHPNTGKRPFQDWGEKLDTTVMGCEAEDAMVCELFHAARSRTLARSHPFFHQIGKDHPCPDCKYYTYIHDVYGFNVPIRSTNLYGSYTVLHLRKKWKNLDVSINCFELIQFFVRSTCDSVIL